MKNTRKNIVIAISILTLCTTFGYTYSELRDKQNTGTRINTLMKNPSDNVDNLTTLPNKRETVKTIEDTKSLAPFSSDIVIYNTHSYEAYPSGINVTDVASSINDKLVSEGLNSKFIKCVQPPVYDKAYQTTRDIITSKVKEYKNTVLLDIHRDASDESESNTKKIMLVVAKENLHYDENNRFANELLQEILKSSNVEASIFYFNKGINFFNQDLSNRSVLIELGNDKSSDNDIEECMNALVAALKNIQIN